MAGKKLVLLLLLAGLMGPVLVSFYLNLQGNKKVEVLNLLSEEEESHEKSQEKETEKEKELFKIKYITSLFFSASKDEYYFQLKEKLLHCILDLPTPPPKS